MKLTPLTDDIFQLALPPRRFVNAYLVGDVLVDAGLGLHGGPVVKTLMERAVKTHVITHAHGDHAGGSQKVTEQLGPPAWCGAAERDPAKLTAFADSLPRGQS